MIIFGNKNGNANEAENNLTVYREIADILGIPAEKQGMIDNPRQYYTDNAERYAERFIEGNDVDDDEIRWIGIIDELLASNKGWGFDFSFYLEDFTECLESILLEGVSLDGISLDEDDDITGWAKAINDSWESSGFVFAALEIDADEFDTFVCTKNDYGKLTALATKIGHRIDLVQNL